MPRLPSFTASASLLHRSRALASMLPALLSSGLATLALSANLPTLLGADGNALFATWQEAWLTSWPIAFPPTYLLGVALQRVVAPLVEKRFSPAQSEA